MHPNLYNPDVLTCLANLSNDEVFTPPQLANQILDMLPQELFENKKTTFLDPCCKSGVFLREIAKRLIKGLEQEIPDLQERLNHIYTKQLFGIAITELTALLSRRSTYCSKFANGEYSVCSNFDSTDGNIWFKRIQHTWENGRCKYCGASQSEYDRDKSLETHAYQFIHNPKELKKMKFDVIVGNPPYQMSDGSGGSTDAAMPIYNKFIDESMKLTPSYLVMIVPSKWMVGGRGLQKFRENMLNEKRIKVLNDFEDANNCFPGVHIDGGVCYFLWEKSYSGETKYIYTAKDGTKTVRNTYLRNKYFDYVIRDARILSILEKTSADKRFSQIVSSTKPYGIRKDLFNSPDRYPDANFSEVKFLDSVRVFGVKGLKGGARRTNSYVSKKIVGSGSDSINKYKLFFTTTFSTNAIIPPEIIQGEPGDVCTETFLLIGPFDEKEVQKNCLSFMETNFFRVLLYFGKGTMQVNKSVFGLIPLQDFNEPWTDEKLYKKYGLTQEEIDFIESMIRPME